jgi:hypothetical protein
MIVRGTVKTLMVETRRLTSKMGLDVPDVVLPAGERDRLLASGDSGDEVQDLSVTLHARKDRSESISTRTSQPMSERTVLTNASTTEYVSPPFFSDSWKGQKEGFN